MRGTIFYGWIIVAVTAVVLVATAGFAALGIRRTRPVAPPAPLHAAG